MVLDLGYDVCHIADTGRGAINYAANNRVDVIVMDIKLKDDIDGISEAARSTAAYRSFTIPPTSTRKPLPAPGSPNLPTFWKNLRSNPASSPASAGPPECSRTDTNQAFPTNTQKFSL